MKFAIDSEEDGRRLVCRCFLSRSHIVRSQFHGKILTRFLNSRLELGIAYRLQQKVDGIYLIAVEGIVFECCGEYDSSALVVDRLCQFHAIEVGHLDVEQQHIDWLFLQCCKCLDAVGKRRFELEVWGTGYKRFEKLDCQRLIVNYYAGHGGIGKNYYGIK